MYPMMHLSQFPKASDASSPPPCVVGSRKRYIIRKFICSRIKKGGAEGKICHAKTMLSLEKPIKLI